jgi:hypothetical protein
MNSLIKNHEEWLIEYRKDKYKIWIIVHLSNNEIIYLKDYSEWTSLLKEYCENNNLCIDTIVLRYRSNSIEIDTKGTKGVYLVKSVLGQMGQSNKYTLTSGKLIDDYVEKSIWLIPELIKHLEEQETIEHCFKEAIIYNHEQENRQTRVI